MPGPVLPLRDPIPDWVKPEHASVFDSNLTKALRMIAGLIGADNPTSQIMGLMGTEIAGGPAGGLVGAVQKLAARAKKLDTEKVIKAYHGSPHDFDKFSLEKIGTGEGAQAYGHGLYFAENEGVANIYKEQLSRRLGATPIDLDAANYPGLDQETANKIANKWFAYQDINPTELHMFRAKAQPNDGAQMLLNDIIDGKIKRPGRMYEVAIKADPDQFLDWDKPLSQQSEAVKKAIVESGLVPEGYERLRQVTGRMDEIAGRPAAQHKIHPEWTQEWDGLAAERSQLMQRFSSHPLSREIQYGNETGGSVYRATTDTELAAQKLRERGIPGIKYLDQGSRSTGEGTRNYVVFDDSLIEILRKYGLIPPATAGMLGQQQDEAR